MTRYELKRLEKTRKQPKNSAKDKILHLIYSIIRIVSPKFIEYPMRNSE